MNPEGPSPGSVPLPTPIPRRTGLAVTSLVLGVLGNLCLGPLAGIPAVICGHVALGRTRRDPSTYAGAGLAIAGLVLGYASFIIGMAMLAILAGISLPALAKAKGTAQSVACINNLKQLGLAARIYSTDNGDRFPTNLAALGPFVGSGRIFVCPADSGHTPITGTNWVTLTPEHVTYEFLTPGMEEKDAVAVAVFRCPIHGSITLGDGSVQMGAGAARAPRTHPAAPQ